MGLAAAVAAGKHLQVGIEARVQHLAVRRNLEAEHLQQPVL